MKLIGTSVITLVLGFSALSISAPTASAEVVCNRDGDCWHVKEHRDYKPEFGLSIHPDNWRWKDGEKSRWREHEGQGCWKDGIWLNFNF